jgi:hypothetical protein
MKNRSKSEVAYKYFAEENICHAQNKMGKEWRGRFGGWGIVEGIAKAIQSEISSSKCHLSMSLNLFCEKMRAISSIRRSV